MASTIWHRAMVYLGLVDDDDQDDPRFSSRGDFSPTRGQVRQFSGVAAPERSGMATQGGDPTSSLGAPRQGAIRRLNGDEISRVSPMVARPQQVKTVTPERATNVNISMPEKYQDVQKIADRIKENQAIIVNVQGVERNLSRRMIDFCAGVTYALGGAMEKVSEQVFLITPANVEVTEAERVRLENRQYRY